MGLAAGQAARVTEQRKHNQNDTKCKELGWVCVPMVVEAYGAWGTEAMESFSFLASLLATSSNRAKAEVLAALYGRLNLNLEPTPQPSSPDALSLTISNSRVHLFILLLYYEMYIQYYKTQNINNNNHAMTCKGGGDVVLCHNSLRDVFAQFCHRARLGGQLEVGHGYGAESSLSRPADILVPNWMIGKPAAFDLTVVSPLNSATLNEAGARSGSAAGKAEVRKHNANDPKCTELGWVCIPLAVESYGCWGVEAQGSISRLAARLALQLQCSKSKAITNIYQRLNLTLVRCNARALLSRARFQHSVGEG